MFETEVGKYIHSDLNIVLLNFLELCEASSIPVRTDRPKHISSQHPYKQEKKKKTRESPQLRCLMRLIPCYYHTDTKDLKDQLTVY